MRVSTHGDCDRWVRYFLRGVKLQADEAAQLADRLIELHGRYREELQAKHVTANTLALIDALFTNPLADSDRVQRVLAVSAPTARNTLRTLEEHGIVQEITAGIGARCIAPKRSTTCS